jgi:hypothetical protein
MEATLGISLYKLSLPQISKNTMSFSLSLMFSLQQNWITKEPKKFCPEAGEGREVAQTMYTHVSKYINNKINFQKDKIGSGL